MSIVVIITIIIIIIIIIIVIIIIVIIVITVIIFLFFQHQQQQHPAYHQQFSPVVADPGHLVFLQLSHLATSVFFFFFSFVHSSEMCYYYNLQDGIRKSELLDFVKRTSEKVKNRLKNGKMEKWILISFN